MSYPYLTRDGRLMLHAVDFNRSARTMRKHLAERGLDLPLDQVQDLLANAFGRNSFYEMKKIASDPDISGWDNSDIQKLIWQRSVSDGEDFPSDLPSRFNAEWQHTAVALFKKAMETNSSQGLEFIAIVGDAGSGKTVLAKHMCSKLGGKVLDIGLSISSGFESDYGPGSILVYDQPHVARKEQAHPSTLPSSKVIEKPRSLSQYERRNRRPFTRIPHDGPMESLRTWLREHPQTTLVLCFNDRDEAAHALQSSTQVFSPGNLKTWRDLNWTKAHIVDLDEMSVFSVSRNTVSSD